MAHTISIHMPKCAGTSFRQALTSAFGEKKVGFDYGDRPLDPASPWSMDPEGSAGRAQAADLATRTRHVDVIHGHFHAAKYDKLDANRVTVLRDPAARLLSHYEYWRATPPSNPLHKYVVAADLTLEQFVRLPALRNLYTRVFLRGHDLDSLDLVGTVEQMDRTMHLMGELLGRRLRLEQVNVTPRTRDHPLLGGDADLSRLVRDLHSDDVDFFHEASRGLVSA